MIIAMINIFITVKHIFFLEIQIQKKINKIKIKKKSD